MRTLDTIPLPPLEFRPPFWARGAHAQTVWGHLLNRAKVRARPTPHRVDLEDGDALLMLEGCPEGPPKAAALLMHGLGGDASGRYMISASERLMKLGFVAFRLNHRAAGGGAGLARRTYHSGLTDDVRAAVEAIRTHRPGLPLVVVGFSMSGNIVLKYLGEEGPRAPIALGIAVNPPIDLTLCMAALESRENRLYHNRFTRLLNNVVKLNTRRSQRPPLIAAVRARSVREYDTEVTAPSWGFESAEHYYAQEGARHVVHQIGTPTFVLTSDDDPVVPVSTFKEVAWPAAVTLHITRGGGHMGYISDKKTPTGDRQWLDYLIDYVAARIAD